MVLIVVETRLSLLWYLLYNSLSSMGSSSIFSNFQFKLHFLISSCLIRDIFLSALHFQKCILCVITGDEAG